MSLKNDYKAYKDGGEAPTVKLPAKVSIKEVVTPESTEVSTLGPIRVILTKEIVDRDGEIVSVKGIKIPALGSLPLLDAHNSHGSVVDNVLGRVINIQKSEEGGERVVTGEIKFASSPRAQIAEGLVRGGFVDSVSIGFRVFDYDSKTRTILESELYELSLVSIPANQEALIAINKFVEEGADVDKTLAHYRSIKSKIKEYRRLLMDDTLWERLGINKTGDELTDVKNLFDKINLLAREVSIAETQPIDEDEVLIEEENLSKVATKSEYTKEQLEQLVQKVIEKYYL